MKTANFFRLAIQRTSDNRWTTDLQKSLVEPGVAEKSFVREAWMSEPGELLSVVLQDLTRILALEITAHDTQSPPH